MATYFKYHIVFTQSTVCQDFWEITGYLIQLPVCVKVQMSIIKQFKNNFFPKLNTVHVLENTIFQDHKAVFAIYICIVHNICHCFCSCIFKTILCI